MAEALVSFTSLVIPVGAGIGYVIAAVHILFIAFQHCRAGVNQRRRIHPDGDDEHGVGSVVMLAVATGTGAVDPDQLTIVVWLAVVNGRCLHHLEPHHRVIGYGIEY
ncbi:MAG: hypothetical protein H6669_05625 [Ardenticatenaceae bacterium]|nr:hypothetical protein [Ardenticatenaceae bacterium]